MKNLSNVSFLRFEILPKKSFVEDIVPFVIKKQPFVKQPKKALDASKLTSIFVLNL